MTPALRCLDCGVRCHPTRWAGGRCPPCDRRRQRARNRRRTQYQGDWQRRSREARRAEPWCHRPGCPAPLTCNLTYDHETGTVECRSCNSSHRRNP